MTRPNRPLTILILTLTTLACTSLGRKPEPAWVPAVCAFVSKEYANINTNLTAPDVAEHGIVPGSRFNVRFRDHRMQAFYGKDYNDVERGEWIALIEEKGLFQLAISYGHAATEIGCAEGDTLYVQAIPEERR